MIGEDEAARELLKGVPSGWKRKLYALAVLAVAAFGAWTFAENQKLESELRHQKLLLAPFQAAAIKVFPGEDQAAAMTKLAEQLEATAQQASERAERDLRAQLENAFVEVVRNGWSLKDLSEITSAGLDQAHVEAASSAALAANTTLDRGTRTLLSLYVTEMKEAAIWMASMNASCERGPIPQQNVENSKSNALEWLEHNTRLRKHIEAAMKKRSFDLPITELAAERGHSVCIAE